MVASEAWMRRRVFLFARREIVVFWYAVVGVPPASFCPRSRLHGRWP
jgi:hypothetical protein